MESRILDGWLEAQRRLRCAVIDDARTARDSGAASFDLEERVLAELRLRREHLKQLIRFLSEEASLEERHAGGVKRHRCRSASKGSRVRAA